jgi:hypothetical protein
MKTQTILLFVLVKRNIRGLEPLFLSQTYTLSESYKILESRGTFE